MSEAYDPFSAKPVKAKKPAQEVPAEPTISIAVAGQEPTPHVPLSTFKEAAKIVVGEFKRSSKRSAPMREAGTAVGGVAGGDLRAFVERIERVHEDKKTLSDDEKLIYAELKARGFDAKAVRTIIRMRKKDEHVRQEEQAVLDLYMEALGMPLFGGGV